MFDLDEYIEEVRKKISRIPDFQKEAVESLLELLPHLDENEKRAMINDINSIVDPAYTSHIIVSKNPVLGFPSEEESKGDGLKLGVVMAGDIEKYPFELTFENLRESILAVARSGHGKTRFMYYFVQSLVSCGVNFVCFDWKRDYRGLAEIHPDILVIRWSDLRFNPLTNVPAGLDIKQWWRVLFTIFAHSFGVLVATPSFILEQLEELYEEKKGLVTFKDLYEHLKRLNEQSKKRGEYLDVAENRIFTVNQALGEVVNVKYGFEISEIFRRKVVIELEPLDTPTASFLVQTLLMHEFFRRLRNQVRL